MPLAQVELCLKKYDDAMQAACACPFAPVAVIFLCQGIVVQVLAHLWRELFGALLGGCVSGDAQ